MRKIKTHKRITVMTGAGVSAESGILTFRDKGGLWEKYRFEEVANPNAFRRDPALVWRFYRMRYENALRAEPNPAHRAIAGLEEVMGDQFHLITQNVDGLHTRAGNRRIVEMHGSLFRSFCVRCGEHFETGMILSDDPVPACPACKGTLRPDIVWFGEMPYEMDRIGNILSQTDIFVVAGTSGVVYPAAQFLEIVRHYGARTIGVNLEEPENARYLDEFHLGKAGEVLPGILESLISVSE